MIAHGAGSRLEPSRGFWPAGPLHDGFWRFQVWAVVGLLIVVPGLTRALQHTPTTQSAGFRFSKSLEPPPEKFFGAHLLADCGAPLAFDPGVCSSPWPCRSEADTRPHLVILRVRTPRAPPAFS
jgi:hypothetical protein